MKKKGRPSSYTKKLAETICSRIASGESVRSIARDPKMPVASTIFDWALNHPEFSEHYATARNIGMEVRAEEIEHIAETMEDIQRAKLVTDVMKWNMSKLLPKRFGDKVDVTSDGKQLKGNTVIFADFDNEADGQ